MPVARGLLRTTITLLAVATGALVVLGGCGDNANECCPRSSTVSGSMQMGGSGACGVQLDFPCSTNWRVERDKNGCEVWRYDVRAPAANEGPSCHPIFDAGRD